MRFAATTDRGTGETPVKPAAGGTPAPLARRNLGPVLAADVFGVVFYEDVRLGG